MKTTKGSLGVKTLIALILGFAGLGCDTTTSYTIPPNPVPNNKPTFKMTELNGTPVNYVEDHPLVKNGTFLYFF